MPTIKQRKAFDKVVENGGNVSRAMLEVDYSPATAKTPQKLTESEGWKQLMAESGLTQKLIATSLVEDIIAKPKQRVKELSLGAEILGMKQKETKENPLDGDLKVILVQINNVLDTKG